MQITFLIEADLLATERAARDGFESTDFLPTETREVHDSSKFKIIFMVNEKCKTLFGGDIILKSKIKVVLQL